MEKLNGSQKLLLSAISNALFGTPFEPKNAPWEEIRNEAFLQAVLPLVYSVSAPFLSPGEKNVWRLSTAGIIAKNTNCTFEHFEVHRLFEKAEIDYVIIKGEASARYYKASTLRTMGDVDFLVHESDIERSKKIIEENGFKKKENDDETGLHIAFKNSAGSTWELHRTLNGIPSGNAGEKCKKYISDIIESAVTVKDGENELKVPNVFHHGFALLLHTASHLYGSGIGLRHLCDWAVFSASLSDGEFKEIFEEKLKDCGLWNFAGLLTAVSEKYLGAPKREWPGTADEEVLQKLIEDIMHGGNFGHKDADRTRQIKYIQNKETKGGAIRQVFTSIDRKAKVKNKSKTKVALDYFSLVIHGKRQLDSKGTLSAAKERKELYGKFGLFEVNE